MALMQSKDALDQVLAGLKSKSEPVKLKAAVELRDLVSTQAKGPSPHPNGDTSKS